MRMLQRAVRREMRLQFVVSIVLFLLGGYVAYASYKSTLVLMLIGMSISAVALRLMQYTIVNLRIDNNRLLRVLRLQPSQVVWVYSVIVERMPFGFFLGRSGTLYFKLLDGTELSVSIPAHKLRTVYRFVNRLLPHATFGYSADRDYAFRVSPESLRRDWSDQLN